MGAGVHGVVRELNSGQITLEELMDDVRPRGGKLLSRLAGGLLSARYRSGGTRQTRRDHRHPHFHLVETPAARRSTRLFSCPRSTRTTELGRVRQVGRRRGQEGRDGQSTLHAARQISDKDPLGIRDTLAVMSRVRGPRLYPVGLAHPEQFDRDHLEQVEEVLKEGKVKAAKAYLGYLHYEPYSPGYAKYFNLASSTRFPSSSTAATPTRGPRRSSTPTR